MRLEDEERLALAVESLCALPLVLEARGLLGALRLHAQGISHFRHQVSVLPCMSVQGRSQ